MPERSHPRSARRPGGRSPVAGPVPLILLLALVAVAVLAPPAVPPTAAQAGGEDYMRRTLELETRLARQDLAAYERARAAETEAQRALNELVSIVGTVLDAPIAGSEAAVNNLGRASDRLETLVADLAAARSRSSRALERLEARLQRAALLAGMIERGQILATADVLSGNWDVTLRPAGSEGVFQLRQDGALVSGTYRMEDGSEGSLRGSYVADRLLLERVDFERGFDSVFEAEVGENGQRMAGFWRPTLLAAGGPGGGDWVAVKMGGGES